MIDEVLLEVFTIVLAFEAGFLFNQALWFRLELRELRRQVGAR